MADESEIIAKDIPEFISVLEDVNNKVTDVNGRITSLMQKVNGDTFSTQEGVSFLEMKYHLLLSYLINLVQYMLMKSNGQSIENCATIDRMIELRTVMEKIRPIDQKLKYQVDKLIKMATTGTAGQENDPLRFKPRPDNLVSKLDDNREDAEDGNDKNPGVYVPPKVAAMHFDDKVSKKRKSEEVARKKALNSSLLRELQEEYSEAPEEIMEGRFPSKSRERDEDDHKERYEEDNFVRLMEKSNKKPGQKPSESLNDLTKFTDLSILTKKHGDIDLSTDEDHGNERSFNKKKRKSKVASGGKLKKNKRTRGFYKRR